MNGVGSSKERTPRLLQYGLRSTLAHGPRAPARLPGIALVIVSGAQSGSSRELAFERLSTDLTTRVPEIEFLVARSPAEFQSIWARHMKPGISGLGPAVISAQQPSVDFTNRILIAFFGGNSPCEPYRITHLFEHPDRITAEVTHPSMSGATCTCAALYAPSIDLVTIQRSPKPVDYIIKPERTQCGPVN